MVTVAFLGLLGSFGHCVGMCSAILVLYNRAEAFQRSGLAWPLAHLGRLTTYALMGLIAGAAGQMIWSYTLKLPSIQGILSITFAVLAFYFALSFVGVVPSVENSFAKLTSRWGKAMRGLTNASQVSPFFAGMLWGLLPCGLVLTALLTAMTAPTALDGMMWMAVFGICTLPSLLLVRWLVDKIPARMWTRSLASMVMMLFGFQLAMRGFSSLGWINRLMIGSVMLW
jgi:sulfite exporter TauE/SafE